MRSKQIRSRSGREARLIHHGLVLMSKADLQLKRARRAMSDGRGEDARAACLDAIARVPNCAEAYYLLGRMALGAEAKSQAVDLFQKAHQLAPSDPKPLIWLASIYSMAFRHDQAREAIERAIPLNPREAEDIHEIGLVLSRLMEDHRALEFYERAALLAPRSAHYAYNLGFSRQANGDASGAERAFRRSVALNPKFYQAYLSLVELKTQTREDNLLSVLEPLFANASDDIERALFLGHAIAKTHEDLGDPVTAMAVLERAKAVRRRRIRYDHARTEDLFEQATRSHPAGIMSGAANPSDAPIFIVGMPRSGTTLTDRILSSHPDVSSAGELHSLALAARTLAAVSAPRLDHPDILRRAASIDVGRLASLYLSETRALRRSRPRLIDKNPFNFLFAGLIHRAMPNARIICLRRDPLDVCLSNYRLMFGQTSAFHDYAYDLGDIARYYVLFDELMTHWGRTLPPDRFTSLEYESLVSNQELETRRLLHFCGLPWDARCLAFHENLSGVTTPSVHQVRSPLFNSSIGRWRRYGETLTASVEVLKQAKLISQT
jgi:tetratricopeptide (TPR) repeat protein